MSSYIQGSFNISTFNLIRHDIVTMITKFICFGNSMSKMLAVYFFSYDCELTSDIFDRKYSESFFQFLSPKGRQPMEIYIIMTTIYDYDNYSYTAVTEWCNKLRQRRKFRFGPSRTCTCCSIRSKYETARICFTCKLTELWKSWRGNCSFHHL